MQATPRASFVQLPAEMLDLILQYLRSTQFLGIRGVSRRWRQAVDDSLERRHHLHLTGDDVRHANDERLERLLRRMPSLRRLTTDHDCCSPRPPLSVDVVSRLLGHMVEVDLLHFDAAPQPLEGLWTRCPRLGAVTLPRRCAEQCAAVLLRRLPSLRRLDVAWSDVLGECLSLLPESLEALSVAWCRHVQPAWLRQLTRCPRLRRLDVSGVKGLQAADLAAVLAGCPQLERLTTWELEPALELCLPPTGLPSLRYLDVTWSGGVTDATLQRLPDLLPGLHTLHTGVCGGVTAVGLDSLPRLRQLCELDLSRLTVTDFTLDRLHGPGLRMLNLSGCRPCSTDGVTRLVLGCPSLTVLGWWVRPNIRRTRPLVDSLVRHLPPNRDVILEVNGGDLQDLQDLQDLLRPGPLSLREYKSWGLFSGLVPGGLHEQGSWRRRRLQRCMLKYRCRAAAVGQQEASSAASS
ncbi:F-box/LRR-repeat protein 2-like [Pollicipes pollicipes]|uniref:F-box/LRR-repeat protein 2-like n=1 Tax=Pollicipes pollicipes TaxID=41117 RepID=UPI001884CAF5|nr:F-box/LRR-repeat protein 2-like [Pollicipes pollicipes]